MELQEEPDNLGFPNVVFPEQGIEINFLWIGNSQLCSTTLIHNLIGCLPLSYEYCKLIGGYWEILRRQLWTLICPIAIVIILSNVSNYTCIYLYLCPMDGSQKCLLLCWQIARPTIWLGCNSVWGNSNSPCGVRWEKVMINMINSSLHRGWVCKIVLCSYIASRKSSLITPKDENSKSSISLKMKFMSEHYCN